MDQSNLPGRYGLLAGRFVPHIAHLCTHKLASLTVLRGESEAASLASKLTSVITQSAEPAAATTLINAIFTSSNDLTLAEVLGDANNGAQVIGKIIAISSLPAAERETMIEATRRVLPTIKAANTPPYRLLLEAVGLPVPAGPGLNRNGAGNWQQGQGPNMHGNRRGGPPGDYAAQYANPGMLMYQPMGQGISPLLIPQNMPLGQAIRNGSPNLGGSPRTPVPRQRGRMSPAQMLSPGSDPFNPVCQWFWECDERRLTSVRLAQH